MESNYDLNVFAGPNAVFDFYCPENHGATPLIEVTDEELNPYLYRGIHIFLKMCNYNPAGTIKGPVAFNMMECAFRQGKFANKHTAVLASSGGTAIATALLVRRYGVKRIVIVMRHTLVQASKDLLMMCGAEEMSPPPKKSAIAYAEELGKQDGWLNLDQYSDTANPEAHEKWLAPQIWKQTNGNVRLISVGLGTSGTDQGLNRHLGGLGVKMLGVQLPADDALPGVRSPSELNQVALVKEVMERNGKLADFSVTIDRESAVMMTLHIMQAKKGGLLSGLTGGFTLAGLHAFFEDMTDEQDRLLRKDSKIIAVAIVGDGPHLYGGISRVIIHDEKMFLS